MALSPEQEKELADLEAWEASRKGDTASVSFTPADAKELADLEAWEASRKTVSPADSARGAAASAMPGFQTMDIPAQTRTSPDMSPDPDLKAEYEKLPEWNDMPELNEMSGGAFKARVGTSGTMDPKDIKGILESQFPGMKVQLDGKYAIATSRDGNRYKYGPGFKPYDLTRVGANAAGMMGVAALASLAPPIAAAGQALGGAGLIGRMIGGGLAAGGQAAANEGIQAATGGDFDGVQPLAQGAFGALLPAAGAAVGAGGRAVANRVFPEGLPGIGGGIVPTRPLPALPGYSAEGGRALEGIQGPGVIPTPMPASLPQTIDTLAPRLPAQAQTLLKSWEANPDLAAIGKRVANFTQPAVDAAETAAAVAAANTEAVTAGAAARKTTGALEATTAAETATAGAAARKTAGALEATTAAEDAAVVARTKAQDAAAGIRTRVEDATADAAAQADAKVAAAAPKGEILDQAGESLKRWGALEPSSLDKKYMEGVRKQLEDATKKTNAQADAITGAMPPSTPVPLDRVGKVVAWIDQKLAESHSKTGSPLLKWARDILLDEKEPLILGTVTHLRQEASNAGYKGSQFPNKTGGLGKKLADMLTAVEMDVADDFGLKSAVEEFRQGVAGRKAYEGSIKQALGIKSAKALNATMVPKMDAAGKALQKGNLKPLMGLLDAAPEGMGPEVMASTVQLAMLENVPADPAGALKHVADFVDTLKKRAVVGTRVFSGLSEEARGELLDIGASARKALEKQALDTAAAKMEEEAATKIARRAGARDLRDVRRAREAEVLAANRAKAATTRELDQKTADAVLAAKRTKATARRALNQETSDTVLAAQDSEAAAKTALGSARAANMPIAPRIRAAGASFEQGDVEPFMDMMADVPPGMEKEVVASVIYHAIHDPADTSAQALRRLARVTSRLDSSPEVMKLITTHLPEAAEGLKDFAEVTRIVYRGTREGTKKGKGFLERLVGGRGGVAGKLLKAQKLLEAQLGLEVSAEAKAANAALASPPVKAILARLALDQPITDATIRSASGTPVFTRLAKANGIPESQRAAWVRSLIMNTGRVVGTPPLDEPIRREK